MAHWRHRMKHTQGKLPDDPTRTTSVRKLNGLTGCGPALFFFLSEHRTMKTHCRRRLYSINGILSPEWLVVDGVELVTENGCRIGKYVAHQIQINRETRDADLSADSDPTLPLRHPGTRPFSAKLVYWFSRYLWWFTIPAFAWLTWLVFRDSFLTARTDTSPKLR